jgi:hypothetical protein
VDECDEDFFLFPVIVSSRVSVCLSVLTCYIVIVQNSYENKGLNIQITLLNYTHLFFTCGIYNRFN